ncbi:hypothetical protein [Lysinibacillus sphaericus]|uniref:hypothetical protein n=1 Tax=Lysinibacillus sphaericus TaxID=1421 RepID=UPI003F55FA9C
MVYIEENLHLLWSKYKRTMNPEKYPVDLSIKEKVVKMINGETKGEEERRNR